MNDDDARDVVAAQTGDHLAFARLYDRHAAVVLSLCRQCSGLASSSSASSSIALADADDACQETFIRAFGMLDRLEANAVATSGAVGGVRSWLYAIARRVCSERKRASIRRLKHEAIAMREAALLIENSTNHVAEDHATSEQLDRLSLAMDQLDDRERLAIHLHYLDADPVQAAESALGLSRSGYYKLLTRARERLAALMGEKASRDQGIKASRKLQ